MQRLAVIAAAVLAHLDQATQPTLEQPESPQLLIDRDELGLGGSEDVVSGAGLGRPLGQGLPQIAGEASRVRYSLGRRTEPELGVILTGSDAPPAAEQDQLDDAGLQSSGQLRSACGIWIVLGDHRDRAAGYRRGSQLSLSSDSPRGHGAGSRGVARPVLRADGASLLRRGWLLGVLPLLFTDVALGVICLRWHFSL